MAADLIVAPLKLCTKCGNSYPSTSDHFYLRGDKRGLRPYCKRCTVKDNRRWMDEHPEEHRRHSRASMHRLRIRQPDYGQRMERRRDKEGRRASQRLWRRKTQIRARNKDKVTHATRKAREAAVLAVYTQAEWARCLSYFNHCCVACRRPAGLWHRLSLDHWTPISKGGPTTAENIVPLCIGTDGCNNSKGNREPGEWLRWRYGEAKARQVEKRVEGYFESLRQYGLRGTGESDGNSE